MLLGSVCEPQESLRLSARLNRGLRKSSVISDALTFRLLIDAAGSGEKRGPGRVFGGENLATGARELKRNHFIFHVVKASKRVKREKERER